MHGGLYMGGLGWVGPMGSYEYALHDLVSIGASVGTSSWPESWAYNRYTVVEVPIAVRAMFHPFNLPVLKERIAVADRLDAYAGAITGWAPYFFVRDQDPNPQPDEGNGRLLMSAVVGGRYYLNSRFGFYAEESWNAFGMINGGVVLKF